MTSFQKYITAQINKIDLEKWLEGCKCGYDPGQEYVLAWIRNRGKEFRDEWECSTCKKCQKTCRYLTKSNCSEFVEDGENEYHKTLDACYKA